jgi:hypothetical protein
MATRGRSHHDRHETFITALDYTDAMRQINIHNQAINIQTGEQDVDL